MKKATWILLIGMIFIGWSTGMAKIDINNATAAELETLPKIGPGLAKTIVDYRDTHGPFNSIHDITNVPRIGEKTFQEIKDYIFVGTAAQPAQTWQPAATDMDGKTNFEPITKGPSEPPPTATPAPTVDEIMAHFVHEPTIREVHGAALKYAEIDPARFAQWRRDVKTNALIPEEVRFTVGHDTDDDTDYGRSKSISLTGGTVTLGPDDETWGHDTDDDWDYELRLKWKLRDFMFNKEILKVSAETEDQVELRQDILNEVTKLYFDRRRLQIEFILDQNVDIWARMKRQLRLEELTAAIDGLTGGYFSDEIAKRIEAK